VFDSLIVVTPRGGPLSLSKRTEHRRFDKLSVTALLGSR
jgi:hypothetical protein